MRAQKIIASWKEPEVETTHGLGLSRSMTDVRRNFLSLRASNYVPELDIALFVSMLLGIRLAMALP